MALRALPLALLCSVTCTATAEITGELRVTTNYVFRGITLSDDAPSVIGGVAYRDQEDTRTHASLLVAGVRMEGESEQQLIARIGHRIPVDDWRFDLGVVYYEFLRGDQYQASTNALQPGTANEQDFPEIYLGLMRANTQFRYSYSEDYFGTGEVSRYYELHYRHPVGEDVYLVAHFGLTYSRAIDDHAYWLGDTALGVVKEPFSLVITNLDDNEDGLQSRNPRVAVTWRQQIGL